MSTRTDLADAATVPNVSNVTPYYRSSLKPGDGFIRLAQRTRSTNGFGFVHKWEVWMAVPSDLTAAEKWIEQNIDALTDAIDSVMVVTTVIPSELVLGSSTVNGLIFSGSIAA